MKEPSGLAMLSDEELSRFIAEKLEPKPEREGEEYVCGLDRSALGAWEYRHSAGCALKHSWQHRDMVNDPAMTVMLMERPGFRRTEHAIFHFSACFGEYGNRTNRCTVSNLKLGRAVAEAFALFNGWREG